MIRKSTSTVLGIGVILTGVLSPSARAQTLPEPIGSGCFALEMEGDGPSVPESVRIDLFEEPLQPGSEMPNYWRRREPVHPFSSSEPEAGVWRGTRREHGLQVEIRDPDLGATATVIFRREGDRLEGVPAIFWRDGEILNVDFTLWATPMECPPDPAGG